jgi:hypothetical protein
MDTPDSVYNKIICQVITQLKDFETECIQSGFHWIFVIQVREINGWFLAKTLTHKHNPDFKKLHTLWQRQLKKTFDSNILTSRLQMANINLPSEKDFILITRKNTRYQCIQLLNQITF